MDLATTNPLIPGDPGALPAVGSTRVCLISIADELFAIDLRNVREVFELDTITPVPGMPTALAGVANLRGVVVPVVDLRLMLGLPVSGPLRYAVAIRHGTQLVAVMVDRVPEIRTVQGDDFLPAPATGSGGLKPFVSAIVRVEDRIGGVVEVPTLMAFMETVE
jgi:purine-binding chemotaxis protein CheW